MEVIEGEREIAGSDSFESATTANEGGETEPVFELLKYSDNQLTAELVEHARVHLNETEENTSRCVQEMSTILTNTPNIYFQNEDSVLILFLRFKKFDVQKAVNLVLSCINHSYKYHEVIGRTDFQVVKKLLDQNVFGYLKYRDAGGRAILWARCALWDIKSTPTEDLIFGGMVSILSSYNNPVSQIAGYVVIIDLDGVHFTQALALVPWINFLIKSLQNACTGFLKNFHMIYTSAIYQFLWSFIKPLLTKKMQKRFIFHKKEDLSTLYKYLPRDVLPPELGGTIPFSNEHWTQDMDGIQRRYHDFIHCNRFINNPKSK